jgi:hypothetical protein
LEIEHLTADHAARSSSRHELVDNLTCIGVWNLACATRRGPRRKGNHDQTSYRSDPRIELTMHRGASASHIVVVHAREVVMDEGIGMHDLDRGGEHRGIRDTARRPIGSEKKGPAEALAADEAVANRSGNLASGRLQESEIIRAETYEGIIDATPIRLQSGDDSHIERTRVTLLKHENP